MAGGDVTQIRAPFCIPGLPKQHWTNACPPQSKHYGALDATRGTESLEILVHRNRGSGGRLGERVRDSGNDALHRS
jgi:hypothetical protein